MPPSTRATDERAPGSDRRDSFGYMLLVWVLVGFSLAGLGASVVMALPAGLPVSALGGGLLFGTVVFVALWVGGFRPSPGTAVGFFVVQGLCSLLLVVVVSGVLHVETGPSSWLTVGRRALAVVLAAVLVFGGVGRRGYDRLREWTLERLQVPQQH